MRKQEQHGFYELMIRNIRTIGFQELSVFVEVVRCGSMTAAADKMGLAKSAVSHQLSKLEERLGVVLLTRSSRRLALTSEGENLLPRVESLLAEGELLFEHALMDKQLPSGEVRIAVTPDFGFYITKHFLPKIGKKFPGIRTLVKMNYDFEDMQDPALDLALRIGRVKDENLVAHELGEFNRILVASPSYLNTNPVASFEDVKNSECLAFSSTSTQRVWEFEHRDKQDKNHALPVSARMAIQSFNALTQLAVAGEGLALVPDFFARSEIESGKLIHVLPEWQSKAMKIFVVYRFGADKIQRVSEVINLIREEIPKITA